MTVAKDNEDIHEGVEQRSLTWSNGEVYFGDVYCNCVHGTGTYHWPDGSTFQGRFYINQKEGYGKFKYADGRVFEGLYKWGERFGPGILTYTDGRQDVGQWQGNTLRRLSCRLPGVQRVKDIGEFKNVLLNHRKILHVKEVMHDLEQVDDECSNMPEEVQTLSTAYNTWVRDRRSRSIDSRCFQTTYFQSRQSNKVQTMMAWNNCDIMIDIQKHAFQHRNYQNALSVPVSDVIRNKRQRFKDSGPQEYAAKQMIRACQVGNLQELRLIMRRDSPNPDVSDCQGNAPLFWAAVHCHADIVNFLLDHGADVNQVNDEGLTPLNLCCVLHYNGNFKQPVAQLYQQLQENKCKDILDLQWEKWDCEETQQEAPEVEHDKTLSEVQPTHEDWRECNTTIPRDNSHMESVNFPKADSSHNSSRYNSDLLHLNPECLSRDSECQTFNEKRREEIQRKLGNNEFKVGTVVTSTALSSSVGLEEIIFLLLSRGADPNISSAPRPPLFMAVQAADVRMINWLIEKNADPNGTISSEEGSLSPLHVACCIRGRDRGSEIVRLLLKHGARPNQRSRPDKAYFTRHVLRQRDCWWSATEEGKTALHVACARQEVDQDILQTVKLLTEYGADLNVTCNGHYSASLAVSSGNKQLVTQLIQDGADTQIPLSHGNGNLFCLLGSPEFEDKWRLQERCDLIKTLIHAGADLTEKVQINDQCWGTPVDYSYHICSLDSRLSQTPLHLLTNKERETARKRVHILSFLADQLRLQCRTRLKRQSQQQTDSRAGRGSLAKSYCYHCGRSAGVTLKPCHKCHQVYFCSKECKTKGWKERHKLECGLQLGAVEVKALKYRTSTKQKCQEKKELPIVEVAENPPEEERNGNDIGTADKSCSEDENYSFN